MSCQRVLIVVCGLEEEKSSLVLSERVRDAVFADGLLCIVEMDFQGGDTATERFCDNPNEDSVSKYFVVDGPDAFTVARNVILEKEDAVSKMYNQESDDLTFYVSTPDTTTEDLLSLNIALMSEQTLAIIKPDAAKRAREILDVIKKYQFTVIKMKKMQLTVDAAKEFYIEHSGREFWVPLSEFMSSGPIFVAVLERTGAIKAWRHLLGPTNSTEAKESHPNCIRALFGTDFRRNACHGSDSNESAEREMHFFFPELKMPNYNDYENLVKEVMTMKNPTIDGHQASGVVPKNESLSETLTRGLKAVIDANPENPIKFLGEWLINEAPSKITAAADIPKPIVNRPAKEP